MARACLQSHYLMPPQSLGFKYLHCSVCHESAHSSPNTFCMFPNWTDPWGENVNMISANLKCYNKIPPIAGLKTVLMKQTGDSINFQTVSHSLKMDES